MKYDEAVTKRPCRSWFSFSYVGFCQALASWFGSRARGAQARPQLERSVPGGKCREDTLL